MPAATYTTRDPEAAVDWINLAYADSAPVMSLRGSQHGFEMTNTTQMLGPMAWVSVDFTTGVHWRVEGVPGLALTKMTGTGVEHTIGDRTTHSGPGQPFIQALPGQPYAITWDEPVNVGVLMLQPAQFTDTYLPADDGLPRFGEFTPVSRALARYCARLMDFATAAEFGAVAGNELVADTARMVAAAVVATFPHATVERLPDHGDVSSRPVIRAVAYIEAHADQPIGLGDIARHTGIGARALQLAFRRHLDTTPTTFLRRVRLDRAHQELRRAERGDGQTVSSIATRWGFSHLGRFAATYRESYGQAPKDTLGNRRRPSL